MSPLRVGPYVRSAVVGVFLHSELSFWSRNTLGIKQEGREKRRKREKKKKGEKKKRKKEKRGEKGKGGHTGAYTLYVYLTHPRSVTYARKESHIFIYMYMLSRNLGCHAWDNDNATTTTTRT